MAEAKHRAYSRPVFDQRITIQSELMEVDFPLHVAKSNTGAVVLSTFASINAVILGAAFVIKQKSGSVKISKKA